MKECFVPFSVAFALQKDSIYTNKFNVKMNQLIEGGFINKWLNDEFDKVAKKADIGASTVAEPLTIDNVQVYKYFVYFSNLRCHKKWYEYIKTILVQLEIIAKIAGPFSFGINDFGISNYGSDW